jgi:hypothetical protein
MSIAQIDRADNDGHVRASSPNGGLVESDAVDSSRWIRPTIPRTAGHYPVDLINFCA